MWAIKHKVGKNMRNLKKIYICDYQDPVNIISKAFSKISSSDF